jgi:hypothetical protein
MWLLLHWLVEKCHKQVPEEGSAEYVDAGALEDRDNLSFSGLCADA